MGARNFEVEWKGKTAKQAFQEAVADALYWHGHDGYTGTIAEKLEFQMVDIPQGKDPYVYVEEQFLDINYEVGKWGPCGCICLTPQKGHDEEKTYLFFGGAPE